MPACARKEIVRPGEFGIFHVSNRVVRRAFLLGRDPLTGNDYSHRRQWVIQRLERLVANFVIDVCFLFPFIFGSGSPVSYVDLVPDIVHAPAVAAVQKVGRIVSAVWVAYALLVPMS